jgi:hypothetical protein
LIKKEIWKWSVLSEWQKENMGDGEGEEGEERLSKTQEKNRAKEAKRAKKMEKNE